MCCADVLRDALPDVPSRLTLVGRSIRRGQYRQGAHAVELKLLAPARAPRDETSLKRCVSHKRIGYRREATRRDTRKCWGIV